MSYVIEKFSEKSLNADIPTGLVKGVVALKEKRGWSIKRIVTAALTDFMYADEEKQRQSYESAYDNYSEDKMPVTPVEAGQMVDDALRRGRGGKQRAKGA